MKKIGETFCWNMKFDVIELENQKLKKYYVGKIVRWAYANKPEEINENEIINVGSTMAASDHFLILVKPNEKDQAAHEKARKELKEKLGFEIAEEKAPWIMWATYNENVYSTFEVLK